MLAKWQLDEQASCQNAIWWNGKSTSCCGANFQDGTNVKMVPWDQISKES